VLRLLLAFLVLSLLGAAPADAATIRVDVEQDRSGGIAKVVFTAAAGEANRVFAVLAPDGAWVLRDGGAPIGVGTGCASLDANSARCAAPPATSSFLEVATGDGDDTVRTADGVSGVRVDAGDGDDIVKGGRGPRRWIGS